MKRHIIIFSVFICCSISLSAQKKTSILEDSYSDAAICHQGYNISCIAKPKGTLKVVDVNVAKFRYDRQCAVSLTFDDGLQEDYTLIAPHLDRYGLKGTFCITGAAIGDLDDHYAPRMTWQQCRELNARGHEIANHSWSHLNEYEIGIEEAKKEISKNDSAIQKELGIHPLTYFFPFNAYSQEALKAAMKNRVACRLYQFGLGQRNLKADWASMTSWLEEQIKGKKWGITMTHGIYTGWDQWEEPWILWNFFQLLSQKSDSVWTATFADVASYTAERDSVSLQVTYEKTKIYVNPQLNLDSALYKLPLTLKINNLGNHVVNVSQDGNLLPIRYNGKQAFIEFDPYGGRIEISEEKKKRVSILGDSYSTITGWCNPVNNENFYPHANVLTAKQTWWYQVIDSGDYVLERNNSYSGSTMINKTLPDWKIPGQLMDVSTSFISRANNLGNPDIILICGGTNDEWNNDYTMGDYKYEGWTEDDLNLFRPGTAYLLNMVKNTYPKAKIIFVLNDILPRVTESIKAICAHYNIPVACPQNIAKDETGHPTADGMTTIANATIRILRQDTK